MVIRAKKAPVIVAGTNFTYDPATFATEHKVHNFHVIEDPEELMRRIEPMEFNGMRLLSMDTETFATDLHNHEIPKGMVRRWVGSGKKAKPQDFPFCVSVYDGKNAYSIFDTLENGFKKFKALKPMFEDTTTTKIFHNAKFDMHILQNIGIKMKGKIVDTVVLAKVANENRNSFMLKKLAEGFDEGIIKFEYMVDAYKKRHKIGDYRMFPRELLAEYANADVNNCFHLFIHEYPILARDDLHELFDTECDLMLALYDMERIGMPLDMDYEKPLKEELTILTEKAERQIYKLAGRAFNTNSSKQLYQVLLDNGADPNWFQTSDAGNPVLDAKAVAKLTSKHELPILDQILVYRKYSKLLGTYAIGLYAQADSEGRVHGSINQTEAVTGRMSITKPALQTLPKKDKRIRRAFMPSPGFSMYMMDLDQVEYRMFAHYAKAKELLAMIIKGYDVHKATAALIFNVPYKEVTPEQRDKAKTMNFALIYGMGKDALAVALGLSKWDADKFKMKYFAALPEANPFIDYVKRLTRTRGYIKNMYKRRRHLDKNQVYKATNALIQSCAADYLKKKIVLIWKWLKKNEYVSRMTNVVHDELIFDIAPGEEHILGKIRWLLSDFDTYLVPITAGVDRGMPSWGQKQEYECDFEAVLAS